VSAALARDLEEVVDAASVHGPSSYSFLGERRELADAPPVTVESGERLPAIVASLANDLYAGLYTRGGRGPWRPTDFQAVRTFVARLSSANSGQGTWEPGWRVVEVDEDGRIEVTREWINLWVHREQLRTRDGAIAPGQRCRVRIGKELRELSPGFYMAIGDGDDDAQADDQPRLLRLYWHLRGEHAVDLLADLTRTLNPTRVPFRFKLLTDPGAYRRADAAVLYFPAVRYHELVEPLAALYRAHREQLRPEVPLFARALAPGLGLAEDPESGESFGQHRCRLVAGALVAAHQRGVEERGARLQALAEAFRQRGLDPARPHLGRGTRDDFPPLPGEPVPQPTRTIAADARAATRDASDRRRKQAAKARKDRSKP
jgi:hypothetical protein